MRKALCENPICFTLFIPQKRYTGEYEFSRFCSRVCRGQWSGAVVSLSEVFSVDDPVALYSKLAGAISSSGRALTVKILKTTQQELTTIMSRLPKAYPEGLSASQVKLRRANLQMELRYETSRTVEGKLNEEKALKAMSNPLTTDMYALSPLVRRRKELC